MWRQFAIFSAMGLISTASDLLCLWLLVQMGAAHLPAVTLAFVVGFLVNLFLHSKVTFQSHLKGPHVIRFIAVVCINYTITIAMVSLFEWLSLSYMLGKFISLPLVTANGYLLSKQWVFKP